MKLSLIVPVGGHPEMYAWGVRCLKYSVETNHPDVAVKILDTRYSEECVRLWCSARRSFGPSLSAGMRKFYLSLGLTEPLQVRPSERFFHYLSLFSQLVVKAPEQLKDDKILSSLLDKHGEQVRTFVSHFDQLLVGEIGPCGNEDCIGVSVYQLLFGHSLFFAHRLRSLYPDATLVMGGDPFDMASAIETVRSQPWLDAVCLGPGEQAILDLIDVIRSGGSVAQADVPRLVNSYFLSDIENSKKKWSAAFEDRSDYAAIRAYHGVEWNPSVQRIQVLGRRGCAWAVCTFCARMHVITKEYVFDPSMNLMRTEIRRLLRLYFSSSLPVGERTSLSFYAGKQVYLPEEKNHLLRISIDADDVDVPAFLDLLCWLKDEIPNGKRVEINSYAPARQMARSEVHNLGKIVDEAPGLNVGLAIPIETLNPKTTITMKKGGNPIDSIKSLKVANDAGCQARGMYFSYYPMESPEDVAEEAYFLRRAFHLVGAGKYNVYIYLGSRRDAIGQDPSQYGLELETRIDPLLQRMGLALDASYNVRYTVMGDSVLSRMQRSYVELVHELVELMYTGRIANLFRALLPGVRCLYGMIRLRNFAYLRRGLWLFRIQFSLGKTKNKLYLDNEDCVHREGAFSRKKKFKLTSDEVAVLRFLYQSRYVGEVRATFSHLTNLGGILERFDRNRWIVRYKQVLISVVNDPAGLRLLADERKLEQISKHYQALDDGQLGRIVPGRNDFTLVTGGP